MTRGKWGEGELRLDQWHHAYLGVILILLGVYVFDSGWPVLIGWYTFWDDILQHFIQWRWDVSYQSPLKYLYGKWVWEPLHK